MAIGEDIGLNAGTPCEDEPCTVSGLREQLRRINVELVCENRLRPANYLRKQDDSPHRRLADESEVRNNPKES